MIAFAPFFRLSFEDGVFRVVVLFICLLLGLSVLFTLVAIGLRIRNDRRQARHERLEAVWEPAMLDVLTGRAEPRSLPAAVPEEARFFFLEYLYRFGRHLRGRELDLVRQTAVPFLGEVAAALQEGDAELRARRLQILGLLGFDRYAGQVTAALEDPSPLVAMVAARALLRREHPDHVSLVLERLPRFENCSHDLLASLLSSVGPEAAPALRRVLVDPARPEWVRRVVALALGRLNDVAAAELAAAILLHEEPSPAMEATLLRLLGRVARPDDLPLVRFFFDTSVPEVRESAIVALGQMSGPGEIVPFLLHALEDESPWVALQAAIGLKRAARADVLRQLAASDHPRAELAQQVLVERKAA